MTFDVACDYFTNGLEMLTNKIKINPNPFNSSITISGFDLPCQIIISDFQGKIIRSFSSIENLNNTSLDFISSGIEFDGEKIKARYLGFDAGSQKYFLTSMKIITRNSKSS